MTSERCRNGYQVTLLQVDQGCAPAQELGHLGPVPDDEQRRAKHEALQRVKDYSRGVRLVGAPPFAIVIRIFFNRSSAHLANCITVISAQPAAIPFTLEPEGHVLQ